VLLVDLDRFKEINDSLGHHLGDEVLRQLGPRLATVVGHAGTVARLGGDEFGLLLAPVAGAAAATDLADRVCCVLREPVVVEGIALRVGASVGIVLAPEHGTSADVLLQKADVAMYHAKRTNRSWDMYSKVRDVHTRQRLELMEDLRVAIERDQLVLHYQPKIDLATGTIAGAEALVRWDHPTLGLLQPAEFLGLMEQSGLIGPLGITVLDKALAQLARWRDEGHDVTVAVNLSPSNFRDASLPDRIEAGLARYRLAPNWLSLEITEECLMADVEESRRVLNRLRALGVELSIDDYGTGFSCLAYLRDLPVSELKLDRTFLANVPGDDRSVAIIKSTFDLAHALGLRIVAEGIETGETLRLVTELGCDVAQGFLLGRPMPADALFASHRAQTMPVLAAAPGGR
jgi:diguanylate cyclase (GGDEF)-like protein